MTNDNKKGESFYNSKFTSAFTGFEIGVTFVYIAGKAKIRDFTNLTRSYQHVSGRQISMDQLN
jgi:hypothetical protein